MMAKNAKKSPSSYSANATSRAGKRRRRDSTTVGSTRRGGGCGGIGGDDDAQEDEQDDDDEYDVEKWTSRHYDNDGNLNDDDVEKDLFDPNPRKNANLGSGPEEGADDDGMFLR